jgi:hypothetical protein
VTHKKCKNPCNYSDLREDLHSHLERTLLEVLERKGTKRAKKEAHSDDSNRTPTTSTDVSGGPEADYTQKIEEIGLSKDFGRL